MKQILISILLFPFLSVMAENVSDTTFVYSGKQIVVSDTAGITTVTVLGKDGETFRKTSETTFADGQEVTQVYVTSPFIPDKWDSRQKKKFYSHIPAISYGIATLGGGAMSLDNSGGMHMDSSRSWELAISPLSVGISLNRCHSLGISFGMQFAWAKMHFKENHALFNDDGNISVAPIEYAEGETFKKSYVSYNALRFPVFLEYQHMIRNRELFVTGGFSFEWRSNEHSRYKTNQNTITPTKDILINPMGVNFELQVGYCGLAFYFRTALTPLMKTSHAPKAFPTSLGIGIDF